MKPIQIIEPRMVLPDTSLCAIVRDEIMNPAGGIVDFVHSTVPFVERAVIVDTGSTDGTREVLEELQAKYDTLEVYDIPFKGFAHARNESLKHVKTKRALILDADERLTRQDFKQLTKMLDDKIKAYNFYFLLVNMDGTTDEYYAEDCLNPRLFDKDYLKFEGIVWECLANNDCTDAIDVAGLIPKIRIKHFNSSPEALDKKHDLFYSKLIAIKKLSQKFSSAMTEILGPERIPSLSDLGIYEECKNQYNPKREEYR